MKEYLYSLATGQKKGPLASFLKAILFLLSVIYGALIRLLTYFSLSKRIKLPLKAVSVGNITLGGTGKTSLVEFIAAVLQERSHKVAILSRGYKKQEGNIGDEPSMLQEKLPEVKVIADKDRIHSANEAADLGMDTAILDDGFQQWGIIKDLDIVAINALQPFGNFQMIPRGILREPLSALKRADIFIITKSNLVPDTKNIKQELNKVNPCAEIFESTHEPAGFYGIDKKDTLIPAASLVGKSALIFSGIGDPDSFESLVRSQGLDVKLSLRFADHHNYSKGDFDRIIKCAREWNSGTLITTEKDAVRLKALIFCNPPPQGMRILIFKIKLLIKNEEQFVSRLLRIYTA